MPLEPSVYVVDDNTELRGSLKFLLESVGHRVQTFGSAQEFLAACRPRQAGVLILDVRMPGMSGMELHGRLKEMGAELHVLFLTGHASVKLAVQAMRDGAVDFFEKPIDEQLLLDRVQEVLAEARTRLAERERREALMARLSLLTPREREVLDLVVQGRRTKEVAAQLNLSTKTVDAHRARIMEKMRSRSVAELVATVKGMEAAWSS